MNLSAPRASPMTLPAWSFAAASSSGTLEHTAFPSPPRLSHNHSVTPREMANLICETLRRNGYQALLVGGCVRDLLLGREPADYDVTTDAKPEAVAKLFPESVVVGAQFGVILIPRDGLKVEVATFRSDVGYSDELTQMLTEGAARQAFELLDETWLLQQVLPEIGAMKGVEQPPQYHPEGDVWMHTRMMLEGLPKDASPTLAWGVLLHDVGKPPTFQSAAQTGDRIRFNNHVEVGVRMTEAICRRLRFSNEDTEQILALVGNHMKFGAVEEMRASTLKRFVQLPLFEEHLALHRLDCLSSHRQLDSYEFVRRFLEVTPPEQVRPERLLTGDDLQAMGFRPGPQFSKILRALEDAQLEGDVTTRREAKEYVLSNFGRKEHRESDCN